MAEIFLICEGYADGVDVRVLNKIVPRLLNREVHIRSAGGDMGLRSVRQYHEERSRELKDGKLHPPTDKAFLIQDRNFWPRHKADATWSSRSTRSLMWRRHEIENYLLAPRVLLAAFNSLRTSANSTALWGARLPADESTVSSLLMDLARPLLEGHAGQLLRFEFDVLISHNHSLSFQVSGGNKRSWTKAEWLPKLRQEAERLQLECDKVKTHTLLEPKAIDAQYETILTRICAPAFLQSGEFLEELGGHELMTALLDHIHSIGLATLRADTLEAELVEAIGREYQPGLFVPDDFAELANRIR